MPRAIEPNRIPNTPTMPTIVLSPLGGMASMTWMNAGMPKKSPARVTTAAPIFRSACAGRSTKIDRKSTRLNSSHSQISYAVFCLKQTNIVRGGLLDLRLDLPDAAFDVLLLADAVDDRGLLLLVRHLLATAVHLKRHILELDAMFS